MHNDTEHGINDFNTHSFIFVGAGANECVRVCAKRTKGARIEKRQEECKRGERGGGLGKESRVREGGEEETREPLL